LGLGALALIAPETREARRGAKPGENYSETIIRLAAAR
jgi:hypothetical protein